MIKRSLVYLRNEETDQKKGRDQEISSLPKKRGRPITLGELDDKFQQCIRSLRRAGCTHLANEWALLNGKLR